MALEVVIVQEGISEIFNFNKNLSWREGPSIDSYYSASSTQVTDTFVLVGGYKDNGDFLDTIYKFDHINYDWILMSQRLQEPRRFAGVVAVPDDFVVCS